MDLTVPGGMGGRDCIRELLKLDPKVKAIVSSGYAEDPVMADYRDHGFSEVVPKPYKMTRLCTAVHRLVEQRRADPKPGGEQACQQ